MKVFTKMKGSRQKNSEEELQKQLSEHVMTAQDFDYMQTTAALSPPKKSNKTKHNPLVSNDKENFSIAEQNSLQNSLSLKKWCLSDKVFTGKNLHLHLDFFEADNEEDYNDLQFHESSKLIEKYFRAWKLHDEKKIRVNVRIMMIDSWFSQYSLHKSLCRWKRHINSLIRLKTRLKKLQSRTVIKNFIFWKLYVSRVRGLKQRSFKHWNRLSRCKKWILTFCLTKLKDAFIRLKRRAKFCKVLPFFKQRVFSRLYNHAKKQIENRDVILSLALSFHKSNQANILFKALFRLRKRRKVEELVEYFLLAKYFKLFRSKLEHIGKITCFRNRKQHMITSLNKLSTEYFFKFRSNTANKILKEMSYTRARKHLLFSGSISEGKIKETNPNFVIATEKKRNSNPPIVILRFVKWRNIFKNKIAMIAASVYFYNKSTAVIFNVWRNNTNRYKAINKSGRDHFYKRIMGSYLRRWLVSLARRQDQVFVHGLFSRRWKSFVFRVLSVVKKRRNMFRDDFYRGIFHFERKSLKKAVGAWSRYHTSHRRIFKFKKVCRFIKLIRALNKLKYLSQNGEVRQLINIRRSEVRFQYSTTKKAFNSLYRHMIRRVQMRRFFLVFRCMFPIPACSRIRCLFDAWKLQFVPRSKRMNTRLHVVKRMIRLNVLKKCLKSWEVAYDGMCEQKLSKMRVMKNFKIILTKIKFSWSMMKHRIKGSEEVFVPSYFHNSNVHHRNQGNSRVITPRKTLYSFWKNNLMLNKFVLPGGFYKICFLKRIFVQWLRKVIEMRNYYYEHRMHVLKLGRQVRQFIHMRCSIKVKLKKSILHRLFIVWKYKRSDCTWIVDKILSKNRLKLGFKAWSFAYTQIFLSRNLFSSPQVKKIMSSRIERKVGNSCSYSNLMNNPYSQKIVSGNISQRHLFQDKFLGYKAISIGKEIGKRNDKDGKNRRYIPHNNSTSESQSSRTITTTPLFRRYSGGGATSPSLINEKSDFYFQNSETFLLTPNASPEKPIWKKSLLS